VPVASGPLAGGHSSLKVASDVTPLTRATLQVSGDGPGTPVVFSGPTQTTAASIPHVAVAPLGSVPPTIESSDPRTKPVLAKEVSANHRPPPRPEAHRDLHMLSALFLALLHTHSLALDALATAGVCSRVLAPFGDIHSFFVLAAWPLECTNAALLVPRVCRHGRGLKRSA
jgi:hypothetical protein